MSTHSPVERNAIIYNFERPRHSPLPVARGTARGELLRLPSRAEAEALRCRRPQGKRNECPAAPEVHPVFPSLVEAVVQINLRSMEAMFQLASPAGLVELQRQVAGEYIAAVIETHVALSQAMIVRMP